MPEAYGEVIRVLGLQENTECGFFFSSVCRYKPELWIYVTFSLHIFTYPIFFCLHDPLLKSALISF